MPTDAINSYDPDTTCPICQLPIADNQRVFEVLGTLAHIAHEAADDNSFDAGDIWSDMDYQTNTLFHATCLSRILFTGTPNPTLPPMVYIHMWALNDQED